MRNKRVLLVRSDVRLAGPGVLMLAVAHALRERGWHVEVAVGSDALTDRFTQGGFAVHIVPGLDLGDRAPIRMGKGAAALRRIVAGSGISIAHSFNAQAGLLAWTATRGKRVRVVNTVLGAGKEGALKRLPFPLIAVSDFVKHDLLRHGVGAKRITTVYNSIMTPDRVLTDKSAFDAAWIARGAHDEFRIVGIAMMNGDKGHRASIDAFARFVARDPARATTLTLVGDGTRRNALESYAKERGIANKVRFAGALDNVFPELDRAHAFLHLSPQETFGMVLAEAHARGLPVVSYAIGGIPEVVANGETGILCALGNIAAVTDALQTLADDRDQCVEMGWRGLERVQRLFMRDSLGAGIEGVYASL
ncbi:glycosyltransferase [Erythrobacter sp. Alg231-14]|uniref:glycosyltransferase n=1 Tax=Erythrobacter sp. Alg231-14 TaxID=1922225 RepID=UPI00307B13B3